MDFGPIKTPWEYRARVVLEWMCLALMGAVALGFFLNWGVVQRLGSWVGLVAVLVMVFGPRVLTARARRRQLREMAAIGFAVCPWCRYDLRTLEGAGQCPECGAEFDARTLEREWRWMLGMAGR